MLRTAALFLLALSLSAADKTYVLKAARLFDGKSDRIVSPGLIVVTNDRIVAVGPAAAIPAGAETIDLATPPSSPA